GAATPALELLPAGAPPDLSELVVVHWFNHGYSATETPKTETLKGEAVYFRERRREPATATFTPGTFADPRDPYVTELGQGLSCALPLALFAAKDGPTLPNRASPP